MSFDPSKAARYGEYVQYVYEMFDHSKPDDLMPPPAQGFEHTGLEITH